MAQGCEPNYFSDEDNFSMGEQWYLSYFAGADSTMLRVGEGSNDYASIIEYPHVAERMAAFNPEMRIVYCVRHPLKRIQSAWVQNRVDRLSCTPAALDDILTVSRDRYLGQSLYWSTLSAFRTHFPDEQIFVGFMEDMNFDQPSFMASLSDFLEVPRFETVKQLRKNPSEGKLVPSRLEDALKRLPAFRSIKKYFPDSFRAEVKNRLLSKPYDAHAMWFSPVVEHELTQILRPEADALLTHYGKSPDYWHWK